MALSVVLVTLAGCSEGSVTPDAAEIVVLDSDGTLANVALTKNAAIVDNRKKA